MIRLSCPAVAGLHVLMATFRHGRILRLDVCTLDLPARMLLGSARLAGYSVLRPTFS